MAGTFVVIDGSSYFFRAFYAVPRLTTRKGFPTNAIKGFNNMLKRVLRRERPDYIAVVFDAARKTFRHEMFPDYKAQRDAMPEDLGKQIPLIKDLPRAMKIPTLELEKFEADDIIATLARKAAADGLQVVVVTQDKDLMQLVTREVEGEAPGVLLFDDAKDRRIGIAQVREKFGVSPAQIPDMLGLSGDSSDNIPGVAGVGSKTAAKLLQEFESVEAIYRDLEKVSREKLRANLEAHKEDALLSKKLATLVDDLPFDFTEREFAVTDPDVEKLVAIYREVEFESELRDLGETSATESTESKVTCLTDADALREFCGRVRDACAVDLLTEGGDALSAQAVGLALAGAKAGPVYVPIGHRVLGETTQVTWDAVRDAMGPLLEREDLLWVGHDLKFLLKFLRRPLAGKMFDVMMAGYVLDPSSGGLEIERLALQWLSRSVPSRAEVLGKGKTAVEPSSLPIEEAAVWCGARASAVGALRAPLEKKLAETGERKVLDEFETPLIPVLAEVESKGVLLDSGFLETMSQEFKGRITRLRSEIHELAGVEFNPDSPKQLAEVLFTRLGLKPVRKTKTGYSTDAAVLEALSADHPLPGRLIRYRGLTKLKATYIDALPALVNSGTGRLHTHYNQAVAATGRLSSSNPNLQNIPIRTEEGRLIRRAFIAPEGARLVLADYSQIELRILAHVSNDETLVETYRTGGDVHVRTASEIFQVPAGSVTPEMRRKAKEVNFGIIYGMSAHGLSRRTQIPIKEAKTYIERYFGRYPGVRAWLDATLQGGRDRGYVETMFGRRRPVPDLTSRNGMLRSAAERVAVNAPLQGAAADLIKIAMIRLHHRLAEQFQARLIMQVHDELVVEAPEGEVESVSELMRNEMEGVHRLEVPLKVDLASGPNWADAKGE